MHTGVEKGVGSMGFVTIRDVAREAGVSTTAVSQILHGKGRFSEPTKELVRRTVQRLGYIPDSRAQAMRSDRTHMVGLLVPDLHNPYFADLVSSMETMLYERGVGALIGTSAESVKRQDAYFMRILSQRIDGVIAVPQGQVSDGLKAVVKRELPLVFVDRRVPGLEQVPYVVSDPKPGLAQALKQLKSFGHQRVAYVSHPSLGSFSVDERTQAFRELAPQVLGPGAAAVYACDGSSSSQEQVLSDILDSSATAVIFGYSRDAVSLFSLLRGRNIAIGSQLSLISFDDIEVFRLISPKVAIISQQANRMGRQGVRILLDRIGSDLEPGSQAVSIATRFQLRDSVGRVA
ncbi:LacI family transcriptional regulator [Bombiscardovia nodaiensis]|uniref:LacI family transcriptional regulator n=1 Tax=Bombiscardovia nodaiensis TaxID=2932181 RepID=A0ABN6SDP9_9BIFI|nr:LacI family transcriptional regulator [Bombiscardovia nodaiensis]